MKVDQRQYLVVGNFETESPSLVERLARHAEHDTESENCEKMISETKKKLLFSAKFAMNLQPKV